MQRMILMVVALIILASCASSTPAPVSDGSAGTIIEPPRPLTEFQLPSSRGTPYGLAEMRGNPTLLFFGYTFCPDICPLTLAEMRNIKADLGAQGEGLNVVFVSVDGERDTPEVLARYIANFDETFVGLQGQDAVLRQISRDYGLYYEKQAVTGTSAAYLVDHSTATYLIDAQGQLRVVYRYGTDPAIIADGVRRLLDE